MGRNMYSSFHKIKLQQESIQFVLILWDARRRNASLTTDVNTGAHQQHVQVSGRDVYISRASWKLLKLVNTITRNLKYPTQTPVTRPHSKTQLTVPCHLISRLSIKRFLRSLTSNTIPNDQYKSLSLFLHNKKLARRTTRLTSHSRAIPRHYV